MPDYPPPAEYTGRPNRHLLPEGTTLWHVHPQSRKPTDFTPHHRNRRAGGGRFDGTPAEPYPAFNAGLDATTTVADYLLTAIPAPFTRSRTVRRSAVAGQRVSALRTAAELSLVSLCDGEDLSAVGQDLWLIHAELCDHPQLARWASWIRARACWAGGFVWPPRTRPQQRVVVLFGDRCDSTVFAPTPTWAVDLDDDFGALWLNSHLVEYNARIMPPRRKD